MSSFIPSNLTSNLTYQIDTVDTKSTTCTTTFTTHNQIPEHYPSSMLIKSNNKTNGLATISSEYASEKMKLNQLSACPRPTYNSDQRTESKTKDY